MMDELIYDEDEDVSDAAYHYLKDHNYKSIFDWAKDNNVLCKGLSKFIADREWQNLKAMQDDPSINYNSIRCL